MSKFFVFFFSALSAVCLSFATYILLRQYLSPLVTQISVIPTPTPVPRTLDKYTILALADRAPANGPVVFDEAVATTSAFTKYTYHFTSGEKKVTGLATIPNEIFVQTPQNTPISQITSNQKLPVIIQFRGWVDPTQYTPGVGTQRSAEVFAQNGFITLAPDFLGYAGSDAPSDNVFESRFETYTTALDIIAAVPSVPFADASRIGMWGHSNGGHIALTVLEILNKPIPTTLWAPVSKPFPYSILYYTDDAEDGGKALRKELASFEKLYDVDLYSLTNYLDRIAGPMILHQGTADDAVPLEWSDLLADKLKKKEKDITYYTYDGADHNMLGSWNTVVTRDIEFFKKNLTFDEN